MKNQNYILTRTPTRGGKYKYTVKDQAGVIISSRLSGRDYVAATIDGEFYFGRIDLIGQGGHGSYLKYRQSEGLDVSPIAYLSRPLPLCLNELTVEDLGDSFHVWHSPHPDITIKDYEFKPASHVCFNTCWDLKPEGYLILEYAAHQKSFNKMMTAVLKVTFEVLEAPGGLDIAINQLLAQAKRFLANEQAKIDNNKNPKN